MIEEKIKLNEDIIVPILLLYPQLIYSIRKDANKLIFLKVGRISENKINHLNNFLGFKTLKRTGNTQRKYQNVYLNSNLLQIGIMYREKNIPYNILEYKYGDQIIKIKYENIT